jgi:anti-anti-sigma factor
MDDKKMISFVTRRGVTVVSFNEPSIYGLADIDKVNDELRQFVGSDKPEKMIVDFSGVKFISSQMLGLLVGLWRKMKEYQGVIIISGIVPQLNRVFKITNLDKIFDFYPDAESALNVLAGD